jgi:hypothetical protein
MKRYLVAATAVALAAGGLVAPVASAEVVDYTTSDAGIVAEYVAGNPTCSDIRPDLTELKVNTGTGGTASDAYATVSYSTPGGGEVVWESTKGIDVVVVKGGPNGNSYVYDPPEELTSDSGLYAPINPSNGMPYGISHVSFCYDVNVEVSKTADTTFTRTFDWDITKEALNDLDLFRGDDGEIDWEVVVTKDEGTDSDWAVSGTISILNPHPTATATVTDVEDVISGVGEVATDCNVPFTIAAGATATCDYSSDLPDGEDRTNTATVSTSGVVLGGEGTADVTFGEPSAVLGDSIEVSDDLFGDFGSTSTSQTFSYSTDHECGSEDGDGYDVPNTATFTGAGGGSASDTAQVNCYDLAVTKEAFTSYTRTWTWDVTKSADQTALTLMPDQEFGVNYAVGVSATALDSDFAVFGEGGIKVYNPAPIAVDLTGVADMFEGAALDVDCGVDFPYTLAAGDTLECDYTGSASGENGTNTATATTEFGVDYSGTAEVDFSTAVVNHVDRCVTISDDRFPGLDGELCAGETATSYTMPAPRGIYATLLSFAECGPQVYANTARLNIGERLLDSDVWTVNVTVPCETGCTLTQGYWKTHSAEGPAKYDDGWKFLPLEEDTPFFNSGKTWYEVFWTAPAGNAYYNLAHQYEAAVLNIANGASSTPEVDAAIAEAAELFTAAPGDTFSGGDRSKALKLATLLDGYNNGLTGPGHCSE